MVAQELRRNDGGRKMLRIVVVLESSARQAFECMTRSMLNPTSVSSNSNKNKNQMMKDKMSIIDRVKVAYLEVSSIVTIGFNEWVRFTERYAEHRVLTKPALSDNLSDRERTLFPDSTFDLRETRRQRTEQQRERAQPPPSSALTHAQKVQSVQDFVDITRGNKCLSYCPPQALPQLASLVHAQLSGANNAPAKSTSKSDHLIAFLLIPTMHLPLGKKTSVISSRLAEGRPYNVELSQQRMVEREKEEIEQTSTSVEEFNRRMAELERRVAEEKAHHLRNQATAMVVAEGEGKRLYEELILMGNQDDDNSGSRRKQKRRKRKAEKQEQAIDDPFEDKIAEASVDAEAQSRSGKNGSREMEVAAKERRIKQLVEKQEEELKELLNGGEHLDATSREEKRKKRLAEAVERLANDSKVRSARKLLFQQVETGNDMQFAEKVELLRKKFVEKDRKNNDHLLPDLMLDKLNVVPAFPPEIITKTMMKIPSQAAPCIDGWNKRLLNDCIKAIPDIAGLLGQLFADILNDLYDTRGMSILRAGRLVGIPKGQSPSDGIRPISIANLLMKICGSLIWHAGLAERPIRHQKGICCPNGAAQTLHCARAEAERGYAIIKIDLSGAFDRTRRCDVAQVLLHDLPLEYGAEPGEPIPDGLHNIIKYFHALYGDENGIKLAVYGPGADNTAYIDMKEGLMQGNTVSTWFFAKVMEKVTKELEQKCPGAIIRTYVDDFTISSPPRHALYVANELRKILTKYGAKVNIGKSKILCKDPNLIGALPMLQLNELDQNIINHARGRIYENVRRYSRPERDNKELGPRTEEEMEAIRRRETELAEIHMSKQIEWHNAVNYIVHDDNTYSIREPDNPMSEEECLLQDQEAISIRSFNVNQDAADQYNDDSESIKIVDTYREEFIVLGGNISENNNEYLKMQRNKLCGFYDVLRKIDLHPQLAFTLARICGFEKARYFANVTKPEHSQNVLAEFDQEAITYLEDLFNIDIADQDFCHRAGGLGIYDYHSNAQTLYQESFNASVLKLKQQDVPLVNAKPPADKKAAAHLAAQHTAWWLRYQPRGRSVRLTPSTFKIGMCIRCGTLPRDLLSSVPRTCVCGEVLMTPLDLINHAQNCQHSGFTPATRHNIMKYDAAQVFRRYGLGVTVEPTMYDGSYTDNHKHRPDLSVYSGPNVITTDFAIMQQDKSGVPGIAAKNAAKAKNKLHSKPVNNYGINHHFVPCTFEAHGHMDNSVMEFIERAGQHLPAFLASEMKKEMVTVMSIALLKARVAAVAAVLNRRSIVLLNEATLEDDDDQQEVVAGLDG